MNDELGGKIMAEFAAMGPKTYSYLTDDNDEVRKQKAQKYDIKQKLKFEDYKYCLEAIEIENKIKVIEKSKLNVGSRTESHKEFRKNYKPILKSQERFRSEKDNVFTD